MQPLMHQKRESSGFVPYRRLGDDIVFFIQKRDKDALRNPDMFGVFGGGFEDNEDAHAALMREVREELNYVPENPQYFSRYETANNIMHIFMEEVGDDFESKIKVDEGEYGIFLNLNEVLAEPKVTLSTQQFVRHIAHFLTT